MPTHLGSFHYARQFLLLVCISGVLVASSRWRMPLGVVASFGTYGALYSTMLVVTLRAPSTVSRTLPFIAIGACLSMFNVELSLFASPSFGRLPGLAGPTLLLTLSAGFGAATFVELIRQLWIPDLALRSFVTISLGCIAATCVVLFSRLYLQMGGDSWFAIIWWFAFSAGLWLQDVRRAGVSRTDAPR